MAFWITLGFVILFAIGAAVREFRAQRRIKASGKRSTIESLKEFAAALGVALVFGFIGFGFFIGLARGASGPDYAEVRSHEMYTLAPNSKFSTTTEDISFTFVREDGKLEAKHVYFDDLRLFQAENEILIVSTEQHYRKWLVPWGMETNTIVSFH